MSAVAIRAEGLSKRYRIGARREQYRTLRDAISDAAARAGRRIAGAVRGRWTAADDPDRTIWALRDVSFEIREGEVVGIVGRNGAGKSTLLKILTRITAPSAGTATVYGRVGSLLEVGTGFHPELTGRENVYLNGAILGMRRRDIERQFDEIVAFSELERFLDTPVKHYSSGMQVRLAFAVAAHLQPDILLVDEVLAVGDLAFQRKCLGKMGEVARGGRTVCLVSHDTAAVQALCETGILMTGGRVIRHGPIDEVIAAYRDRVLTEAERGSVLPAFSEEQGLGIDRCAVHLEPDPDAGLTLRVEVDVRATRRRENIGVGLALRSSSGALVSRIAPAITNFVVPELLGSCRCSFVCEGIDRYLAGGEYVLDVWLAKPRIEQLLSVENAALLRLPARDVYATGAAFEARRHGPVPLRMKFHLRPADGC